MTSHTLVFVWMAVALWGLGLSTMLAFPKVSGQLIPNNVKKGRSKRRSSPPAAAGPSE